MPPKHKEPPVNMLSFLASEFKPAAAKAANYQVIPAPMELSVSYGSGAKRGPAAILAASQQLEAELYGLKPTRIHTQKPVSPTKPRDAASWLDAIERAVAQSLIDESVPVLLGGEHTVTLGAARAFKDLGRDVGFVQFDAHADLRNEYEGSPLSHACVLRRVHELGFPLLQIANRAVSREEIDYRTANRKAITAYDAIDIADGKFPHDFIPRRFPKQIYITFDVDGLDSSLMPATGTPAPGGLFWYDTVRILRELAEHRTIVGFDVVELAPIKGLHHADFTAAVLTQLLMGLTKPRRLNH